MILVCLRNSTQLKGDFRPFEYGISKTIFAKDFSLRIFGKPEARTILHLQLFLDLLTSCLFTWTTYLEAQ